VAVMPRKRFGRAAESGGTTRSEDGTRQDRSVPRRRVASPRRQEPTKDALVCDGVPAQAISVVGMGEKGLLVPTGDNVREPQNRRVEIVIQ
jgi:OOP family OmpA-OmpF porin